MFQNFVEFLFRGKLDKSQVEGVGREFGSVVTAGIRKGMSGAGGSSDGGANTSSAGSGGSNGAEFASALGFNKGSASYRGITKQFEALGVDAGIEFTRGYLKSIGNLGKSKLANFDSVASSVFSDRNRFLTTEDTASGGGGERAAGGSGGGGGMAGHGSLGLGYTAMDAALRRFDRKTGIPLLSSVGGIYGLRQMGTMMGLEGAALSSGVGILGAGAVAAGAIAYAGTNQDSLSHPSQSPLIARMIAAREWGGSWNYRGPADRGLFDSIAGGRRDTSGTVGGFDLFGRNPISETYGYDADVRESREETAARNFGSTKDVWRREALVGKAGISRSRAGVSFARQYSQNENPTREANVGNAEINVELKRMRESLSVESASPQMRAIMAAEYAAGYDKEGGGIGISRARMASTWAQRSWELGHASQVRHAGASLEAAGILSPGMRAVSGLDIRESYVDEMERIQFEYGDPEKDSQKLAEKRARQAGADSRLAANLKVAPAERNTSAARANMIAGGEALLARVWNPAERRVAETDWSTKMFAFQMGLNPNDPMVQEHGFIQQAKTAYEFDASARNRIVGASAENWSSQFWRQSDKMQARVSMDTAQFAREHGYGEGNELVQKFREMRAGSVSNEYRLGTVRPLEFQTRQSEISGAAATSAPGAQGIVSIAAEFTNKLIELNRAMSEGGKETEEFYKRLIGVTKGQQAVAVFEANRDISSGGGNVLGGVASTIVASAGIHSPGGAGPSLAIFGRQLLTQKAGQVASSMGTWAIDKILNRIVPEMTPEELAAEQQNPLKSRKSALYTIFRGTGIPDAINAKRHRGAGKNSPEGEVDRINSGHPAGGTGFSDAANALNVPVGVFNSATSVFDNAVNRFASIIDSHLSRLGSSGGGDFGGGFFASLGGGSGASASTTFRSAGSGIFNHNVPISGPAGLGPLGPAASYALGKFIPLLGGALAKLRAQGGELIAGRGDSLPGVPLGTLHPDRVGNLGREGPLDPSGNATNLDDPKRAGASGGWMALAGVAGMVAGAVGQKTGSPVGAAAISAAVSGTLYGITAGAAGGAAMAGASFGAAVLMQPGHSRMAYIGSGALAGASIGFMIGGLVGGPVGALVGAAIGTVVGAGVGFIRSMFSHGNIYEYQQRIQKEQIRNQIGFLGGDTNHDSLFGLQQALLQAQHNLMVKNVGHFFDARSRTLMLSTNGTDVDYGLGYVPRAIPGQFGGVTAPASNYAPHQDITDQVLEVIRTNPGAMANSVRNIMLSTSSLPASIRDNS